MAEARQTIIERVALFRMVLEGGEEVEKRIEVVDEKFTRMASQIRNNVKMMNELSQALRVVGRTMSGTVLQQLPQTTAFLEQFAIATEGATERGEELTLVEFALSKEGRELATSLGLVIPKLRKTKEEAGSLKDAFWKLNSMARGLLRVFVAFKILTGLVGVFGDIARATVELQMEMWRLRATALAVGESLEGSAPAWEEWVEMVSRLRRDLPYVSTKEIAEGLRQITAIVGPLGLTADQLEILTRLIGQMSLVVGQDFLPYMRLIITAATGTGRAVASLGIDLRDASVGLHNYAEAAGLVWDELNAQQRIYIRLAYAVGVMIERTELLADAEKEDWVQLKNLQATRADLMAQSPELVRTNLLWQTVLLQVTELLIKVAQKVNEVIASILAFGMAIGVVTVQMGILRGLRAAIFGAEAVEDIERFNEVYGELKKGLLGVGEGYGEITEQFEAFGIGVEDAAEGMSEFEKALLAMALAAGDAEDAFDDLGDALSRALSQARSALRSWRQAIEQAQIQLSRRLADIIRNLNERLYDLEQRFQARRDQLLARFEERRAKVREEGAEREEELREEHNKDLQRMEEDHQREMRQLRDEYLLDLEDAARRRDAISMRRIQQRYTLEKKQREEDYDVNRHRAIEDFKEQLEELKEATQEQLEELRDSLQLQLRELQENYARQQEEARRNAERQRQDALRNYQEREADLWESLQNRLEAILTGLMEEEEEWEGTYGELRSFLDKWYEGDLGALRDWLNERLGLLQQHPGSPYAAPSGYTVSPYLTAFGLAQGGMGIARGPTSLVVGESGPEMFAAWPLGQRMPRAGVDIRLTIDGEQRGAWSGDFENQVLRVMRGVLEEVL